MSIRIHIILMLIILLTGCRELNEIMESYESESPQLAMVGDVERGKNLFKASIGDAPPCSTCHQVGQGGFGPSLAPNLKGIADRVSEHDTALTPQAYIRESIIDPLSYEVPGYRVSMYPDYAEHLSKQQIADLVAYLMSI